MANKTEKNQTPINRLIQHLWSPGAKREKIETRFNCRKKDSFDPSSSSSSMKEGLRMTVPPSNT